MRIGCIYTVETYNSIECPLSSATEIPFGISIIATVLIEAGYDVDLLVITPDTPLDESIGGYINKHRPGMLCMSSVSTQYWRVREIAQYVQNLDSSVYCVLGGHHSSLNGDEVINEGVFDSICIGEGEKAIISLANVLSESKFNVSTRMILNYDIPNLWFRNVETRQVFKNNTDPFSQNLDDLPFINRELWDPFIEYPDDYPSILLGRGCPFKCTYCSNHAMELLSEGRYVRFRSPQNIVDEIKSIREVYPGVERIYLEVETFGANRKASYAVFDALSEYNKSCDKPVRFGVNMALTSNYMMNAERRIELFEKVREANITTINIGLESGSERVRELLKRPPYSNNEIIEFCHEAKRHDIKVIFFILLGLPGETVQDYRETVRVARMAQPYTCYVSIFFPYLGTDLADTAIAMGLINKESLSPKGERSNAQLDLPGFSKRRIRFEYIIFYWRVYVGHWSLLKVLANVFSSFLKAYPRWYSIYIKIRNNSSLLRKIASMLSGSGHKLQKSRKTVGVREDVIRD